MITLYRCFHQGHYFAWHEDPILVIAPCHICNRYLGTTTREGRKVTDPVVLAAYALGGIEAVDAMKKAPSSE